MKTVALTGGIGSGKSTARSVLTGMGIPVYDSDSAAKRLYREDDSLLDSIESAFGRSVRASDGSPDFRKIASIVFSSQDRLATLESIVHPAVLSDFRRWKASMESRDEVAPFCVLESAIILEKPDFLKYIDKVVLVDASLQTRLKRASERDGVEPSEILKRMAVQRFDLSKVDAIIHNDGTKEELEAEVRKVFRSLGLL
jgi:dephospho-CoA kinase